MTQEEEDRLKYQVEQYCANKGYDWTFEEIVEKYRNDYSKNYYVSKSCKDVCMYFESALLNYINM